MNASLMGGGTPPEGYLATLGDVRRIVREEIEAALKGNVTNVTNLPPVINIYGPADVDPLATVEQAVKHLRLHLNFDRKPGDE